jgi:DNA-binding IclR family transcriptional regulator
VKSLDVARTLYQHGPLTVTELADKLPYSKSTVHRHLRTLHEAEYIVEDEDGFRISMLYLDYGLAARSQSPFYRAAKPKLEELANETAEKVWVMVEEHGCAVFLDRALGTRSVETYARVGERGHLHHYAAGKAILAHLDREWVEEIIDRRGLPAHTDDSITTAEELFHQLERIREEGVAYNLSESITGINAVGAPILDNDGAPHGAISVAGPASRLDGEYLDSDLASLVQGVANEIEVQLTVESRRSGR